MLPDRRIVALGTTPHEHEAEAIDFLREVLPDRDPFHFWGLIRHTDTSGRLHELDAIVLGRYGLYVVEIKSHPCTFDDADGIDWELRWPQGHTTRMTNPLGATQLKAQILATELKRKLGHAAPWVEPLVFLSHTQASNLLRDRQGAKVVVRSTVLRAFTHGDYPGSEGRPGPLRVVDKPVMRKTIQALQAMGLKASKAALAVAELEVGAVVGEGPGWQDRIARNRAMEGLERRVRFYLVPRGTSAEQLTRLTRAARREASVLTALGDHPHIPRVERFVPDGPLGGPCLVGESVGNALPLDLFLRRPRPGGDKAPLTLDERIALIEQVGRALAYCHGKSVLHRALDPGAVLVRWRSDAERAERPGSAPLHAYLHNFQLATEADRSSATRLDTGLFHQARVDLYRAPEVHEDPDAASSASDLFSLGCLAYRVLTGQDPGRTLAERCQLLGTGGLSLAAADDALADGIGDGRPDAPAESLRSLDAAVQFATAPSVHARADDVSEWLELFLDAASDPSGPPADQPERARDPLDARSGEDLCGSDADGAEARFVVDRVLGEGASCRVLRVLDEDNRTVALKVPLNADVEVLIRPFFPGRAGARRAGQACGARPAMSSRSL